MSIIKNILAFISCVPFWAVLVWLYSNAMDFLVNAVDSMEDTGVLMIIKPIAGLVVSFPTVFICLGVTLWALAEHSVLLESYQINFYA